MSLVLRKLLHRPNAFKETRLSGLVNISEYDKSYFYFKNVIALLEVEAQYFSVLLSRTIDLG